MKQARYASSIGVLALFLIVAIMAATAAGSNAASTSVSQQAKHGAKFGIGTACQKWIDKAGNVHTRGCSSKCRHEKKKCLRRVPRCSRMHERCVKPVGIPNCKENYDTEACRGKFVYPDDSCLLSDPGCKMWLNPPGNLEVNDPPCAFSKNGCEETLEATEMKMHLEVDDSTTPATESTWGCAKLQFPYKHNLTIRFLAIYGSFQSSVWGGYKGPSAAPIYCSEYIPPPHPEYVACSSDDLRVIDTAWVVVLDSTTGKFVESERIKFNINNPEEEVKGVSCPVG